MKNLILFSLLLVASLMHAQEVSYEKITMPAAQLVGTVNFGEIVDQYEVGLQSLEAPDVSGPSYKNYLASLKNDINTVYPPKESTKPETRSVADPPRIIRSWKGNSASVGTPLDTHLAVSNSGQVISTVNSHIAIFDREGEKLNSFGFHVFALGQSIPANLFDPRVFYDSNEDRFVLMFLGGNTSDNTKIIIGFSQTNDALGDWNLYTLEGNPNMVDNWTDFPMITITDTDFLLSINYIKDDVSWQLGFEKTGIWQIDKSEGYDGVALNSILWQEIQYDNRYIRNMCPVKSGDGVNADNTYFLSNRNFEMESDSFFLMNLTGGIDDPNSELIIDLVQSDVPYGVPPNATQANGFLQTNDARVLEGMLVGDEIHFVGNTRNLDNNMAGIYHGILSGLDGTKSIALQHIIGVDFEIGYPGISQVGDENAASIINFSHSSADIFPGTSALYYNNVDGHSDIITVHEGVTTINIIGGVNRWGDYAGSQREHSNPEVVWVSNTYGTGNNNNNRPWVAALASPEGVLSNEDISIDLEENIYPNPVEKRMHVEFEIPKDSKQLNIQLLDNDGRLVDVLHHQDVTKSGSNRFSFNVHHLKSGIYFINISLDRRAPIIKQIVVQH